MWVCIMIELYLKNRDFKEYVDRYCRQYRVTIEQALEHAIVKRVADYYVKGW